MHLDKPIFDPKHELGHLFSIDPDAVQVAKVQPGREIKQTDICYRIPLSSKADVATAFSLKNFLYPNRVDAQVIVDAAPATDTGTLFIAMAAFDRKCHRSNTPIYANASMRSDLNLGAAPVTIRNGFCKLTAMRESYLNGSIPIPDIRSLASSGVGR